MEDFAIDYSLSKKGFNVRINSQKFYVQYPQNIWNSFPKKIMKTVVENFVFLATSTFPAFINKKSVYYNMNSPILGSFFLKPVLYYIPACADEYNRDSFSLLRRVMNTTYNFKSYNIKMNDYMPDVDNRAVILFTFGKDSLLSYAVAEEIGMHPAMIYVEEPDVDYVDQKTRKKVKGYENMHKEKLISRFNAEFKKPIFRIKNNLGTIREATNLGVTEAELPWGSQLTEYALLCLPFNHYFKARYLVYGNEASCSSTYMNRDGLLTYPVFDQSSEWTVEISKLLKLLTKKMSAISLIEPIHEIAVTKILHERYPHYAKYQTSCFATTNSARYSRWCHDCSKCARMYVFLTANKIDPAVVGFNENMFRKDKMHLYSLFGADGKKSYTVPYDLAGTGRDEQLLAFYLSVENGCKGYLIDAFRKKLFKEAESRREELFKEFYSVHDSMTIPPKLKNKAMAIYREVLGQAPLQQVLAKATV